MVSRRTLFGVALVLGALATEARAQAPQPQPEAPPLAQPPPDAPLPLPPDVEPGPAPEAPPSPVMTAPGPAPTPEPQPLPAVAPLDEAASAPSDGEPFSLDVHAFVSQGFILSIRNNYLAEAKNGSVEFAEAGINFTMPLSDRMRVGVQLFTRDLGPIGNYDATFDWFYLDYKLFDWLGVRAGRVKVPFGLYNEFSDIDAARPFVLLPQSMYSLQNRDFLLAQTGGELYGYLDLSDFGALEYRAYGGTIWLEDNSGPNSATKIHYINIPYLAGGRLLWETPLAGLRVGGSLQLLRLEVAGVVDPAVVAMLKMLDKLPAMATGAVEASGDAVLAVASVEYAAYDWLLAAEYGRQRNETESTEPALSREGITTVERMYVAIAYRITPWLQPGAYYAVQFPDVDDRSGRTQQQHDLALSVRFDVNEHWLFKLEGHFFDGTAQLSSALNEGKQRKDLKRQWGMLLAKTTAYF
jgi:hypothetical protein